MQRVLIVDRQPAVRAVCRRTLEAEYTLAEASSGAEALRHASDFLPDIVLIDTELRDMSGSELIERMRASVSPGAQFVLATAKREPYPNGPADARLAKPYTPGELRSTLMGLQHPRAD